MQILNKEEYKNISISELGFSGRTYNTLMRAGYNSLFLLIENYNLLPTVRHLGNKSLIEIEDVLANIQIVNGTIQKEEPSSIKGNGSVSVSGKTTLPEAIANRSLNELVISTHTRNILKYNHINTIGEASLLKREDLLKFRSMGKHYTEELLEELKKVSADREEYFSKNYKDSQENAQNNLEGKGFDFQVIDILTKKFFLKPSRMCFWFNLSRQGVYNAIEKRSPLRKATWTGKELTEKERAILADLVKEKKFEHADELVTVCLLNNRQDDLACIFVYEKEIKCFFLKDFPEEIRKMLEDAGFHRFTEKELSGGNDGKIIYWLRKPYFLPDDPYVFRANAQNRKMSVDEYSVFLNGCPMADARSKTDEEVIQFFKENLIDGKVYLSSDPKNQWIRSLASRNGYTIKEFVELYGFTSRLDGTELTTDGARGRHIEELKNYVVHDNVVYFPTDSHIYKVLATYCYNKKLVINEYIRSLGFERTSERPEVTVDVLEEDMQVRKVGGKFEDKVFGAYPLLGSKILKPATLEKLNGYARKYIDTVLNDPYAKLNLRAKMQITLALINNAKGWKYEDNGNFWNYISLQFGYRDTNGAVVRLLQTSLEDAMKKNRRLFIEDANGRGFKSTAVIHALSTRKSWMALFDFLFDFYKSNLNWRFIPGDPLFGVMVRSLQKKLDASNAEEAELEISSRVYSFQEGIRKLVIFRPEYSRELFERLVGRIDSLVNSETSPVKTYEEQLCDEWFEEKITAIANSRRSVRQGQSIPREVVIDYSRIRPKFILKNENSISMLLPDIRLKGEGYREVYLAVFYDEEEVCHRRMETYGDELGKSISGVSLMLPSFDPAAKGLNIRVVITGDDETIYDSEDTLYRGVFAFSAGVDTAVNQIKKDKYTIVLPQGVPFEAQNAEVSSIDDFKISGLKAYYIELSDGYILTVGGKLLSFDSGGGSDIRVLAPVESLLLPVVSREETDCCFAYKDSCCSILLSDSEYAKQYVVLKNGERVEFSDLTVVENTGGKAYSCPIDGVEDDVRIQLINLDNERLVFDRSFIRISSAECNFNREFYYSQADYKNAQFTLHIDDYEEHVPFTEEDEEVSIPYRDGMLHMNIPKVTIQETTGLWLNGESAVWYAGNIPQNSFLKVTAPQETGIRFLVGGKDIMYDGQGLVTIGNILQSFVCSQDLSIADIVMEVKGREQSGRYLISRVAFEERFLRDPKFWTNNGKIYWDQGNGFIGKAGRSFSLSLIGENNEAFEYKLDESTECFDLPDELAIGNYRYEISILSGSLFKKERKVIAKGDCVIGDPDLLRFRKRRIAIYAVTDEFNEEAGHISITPCFIDHLEFLGIQETSEGNCPVYSGILYTIGYHGERYEFSYEEHVNSRGVKKMMVNPVRVVYIGESALCITDLDGDGLYYYHYYNKYQDETIFALTDHEYTPVNKRNYSNADLYLYRTERI